MPGNDSKTVEPKIDGANETHQSDRARRGPPVEVPADIKPFEPRLSQSQWVSLEGGPLDGTEVEIWRSSMTYAATVPYEGPKEDFIFDPEEHRKYVQSGGKEGKMNIVRGDYDTVNYKRSKRKTADGMPIFEVVAK